MKKIAYIIEPGYQDCLKEEAVLQPLGYQVKRLHWQGDIPLLRQSLENASLVFVRDTPLDNTTIEHMHHVKGIIRYGVGLDNIDVEAATQKGIIVTRIPNYGAEIEVADHTLAMLLNLRRRIHTRDIAVRNGAWNIAQQEPIQRFADSTMGFLGYGNIARGVATRMKAFGVKHFIAYDPFLNAKSDINHGTNDGVQLVSLDQLAQQSDMISLHAPSTADNYHIINEHFLSKMKAHAIIVNTSRGKLIDEKALYHALDNNQIQGAGLDVFEQEPPVNHSLFQLSNIILSDHNAWYSEKSVENMQTQAAEQAKQIITTGTASNRVN